MQERCEICDSKTAQMSHPASLLTDLSSNQTCWISDSVVSFPHNVTLTLSLGKKFEITFVSLHFCSRLADSLAIYKSSNRGKTWTPFQFYSTECEKMYKRKPSVEVTRHNEQEVLCTNSHIQSPLSQRIAFATLEGRPSAMDFEQSPVLQDWVTATDIRIVFNRLSPNQAEMLYGIKDPKSTEETSSEDNLNNNSISDLSVESDSPFDSAQRNLFYALSELAVGGRCKCNGHASRCIFDKFGRYACDCKHGTTGTDCEKCKLFHYDRPWARATAEDAHSCIPCNCNLHSRRCRFNAELYRLSGYKSGGICLNCRHNTAGRNCHYCKLGYYRDQEKSITHRKACRPCLCHPIGSLSKNCNQMNGQCICKPGVEGPTCNRCAKGFQQSRSPLAPCIRPVPVEVLNDSISSAAKCEKCKANTLKFTHKKYCKSDYAITVQFIGRELIDDWTKYKLLVLAVQKPDSSEVQSKDTLNFWAPNSSVMCKCPRIKIGRRYLIMGRFDRFSNSVTDSKKGVDYRLSKKPIFFNKHTLLFDLSEELLLSLERFRRHHFRTKCLRTYTKYVTEGNQLDDESGGLSY